MNNLSLAYGFRNPHDLLEKAKREQSHLVRALGNQDLREIADTVFNFVITAYHVKDWLKKEGSCSFTAQDVEHYVANEPCLKICRDICNGSKHRILDRGQGSNISKMVDLPLMVDTEAITAASSIPINAETPHIELQDGRNLEILAFVNEVIAAWNTFFQNHGL